VGILAEGLRVVKDFRCTIPLAMPNPLDVVVVGGYCLDLIFTGLTEFPRLGAEIVGGGFDLVAGGAFNSAAAMHRLGLRVGWAADFGADDLSAYVLARARAEDLDETFFAFHPGPLRHITVALSYPQDRAFVAYYDPPPGAPASARAIAQAPARAIYLAHFHAPGPALEAALARAQRDGIQLIMDGNASNQNPRLWQAGPQRALPHLSVFLPNSAEARQLTGHDDLQAAIRALAELCPVVVVKDGAAGAYACAGGEIFHQPALAVAPVDTTGAGDCFSAGFVKAWLDGLSLAECLRWGNVVGGLSTLAVGGAGRVVTADEVRQWL
jgi:sugar/nucleoside kinase (ribokinase family)